MVEQEEKQHKNKRDQRVADDYALVEHERSPNSRRNVLPVGLRRRLKGRRQMRIMELAHN
jgi:hypothetical protein